MSAGLLLLVLVLVSSIWVFLHELKVHVHHLFHQLLQDAGGQRSKTMGRKQIRKYDDIFFKKKKSCINKY